MHPRYHSICDPAVAPSGSSNPFACNVAIRDALLRRLKPFRAPGSEVMVLADEGWLLHFTSYSSLLTPCIQTSSSKPSLFTRITPLSVFLTIAMTSTSTDAASTRPLL